MGFWNNLFSKLGWGSTGETSKPPLITQQSTSTSTPVKPASPRLTAGVIRTGRVEYIGEKFVKILAPDVKATIFLGEISLVHIDHPSDVLREGQEVELVLLRPSDKKPGEWIASINAVTEARALCAFRFIDG